MLHHSQQPEVIDQKEKRTVAEENLRKCHYENTQASMSHSYLLSPLRAELASLGHLSSKLLFKRGSGNVRLANIPGTDNWAVSSSDPSQEGIAEVRKNSSHVRLETASDNNDLACRSRRSPIVTSLEVVGYDYAQRNHARRLFDLLAPGGITTILRHYHGYLKNLAMAVRGQATKNLTAPWDLGPIKFWSIRPLAVPLPEAGLRGIRFLRVDPRLALARSPIAIACHPA